MTSSVAWERAWCASSTFMYAPLIDFYGRAFDPRNMGVSVCRNRGEGEFLMRDHSSRVRVDLSQPSVALSQVHLAEL